MNFGVWLVDITTYIDFVHCAGDGGLDELTEDFNPSKIQYAFLKVEDQKTSLPKFVLINWQVCVFLSVPNILFF